MSIETGVGFPVGVEPFGAFYDVDGTGGAGQESHQRSLEEIMADLHRASEGSADLANAVTSALGLRARVESGELTVEAAEAILDDIESGLKR